MDESQLRQIRRFNRLVTRRVGALETNYLRRGRPLAEARLIFEIGADGVDVRTLRSCSRMRRASARRCSCSVNTGTAVGAG